MSKNRDILQAFNLMMLLSGGLLLGAILASGGLHWPADLVFVSGSLG